MPSTSKTPPLDKLGGLTTPRYVPFDFSHVSVPNNSYKQQLADQKDLMYEQLALAETYNAKDRSWSAKQAQKQMEFQERLSSTAHQREVQDLLAAGLNPVLSAGGNGASTPQGASAESASMSALVPDLLNNMNVQAELNYKKEKDAQDHQLDLAKLDLERSKFEAQQNANSAALAATLSGLRAGSDSGTGSSGGRSGGTGRGKSSGYSSSGSYGKYWYTDYIKALVDGLIGSDDHAGALDAANMTGQQIANVFSAVLGARDNLINKGQEALDSAKAWAKQKEAEAKVRKAERKQKEHERERSQDNRNIPGMYDITHPWSKLTVVKK